MIKIFFYSIYFYYFYTINLKLINMKNLTNELKQRVKKTTCPIQNELSEQFEATQFHKSMIRFHESVEIQFFQKSLIYNK